MIVVAAVVGVSLAESPLITVLAVLGAAAAAVLLKVQLTQLASVALVGYALVPVKYLPWPAGPGLVSGGLLVMFAWGVREALLSLDHRPYAITRIPKLLGMIVAASVAWLAIDYVRTDGALTHLDLSVQGWSLNYLGLVLLPVWLIVRRPQCAPLLEKTWATTAGVLGVVAAAEAWLIHSNPLFGHLYESAANPVAQTWSVYRATTSLGHPLVNATFFAVGGVVALGLALRGEGFIWSIAAGAAGVGVLATSSRGALAALITTTFVVAALAVRWRSGSRRTVVLLSIVALIALAGTVLFAGSLRERSDSAEARSSSSVRQESLSVALSLARTSPVFGVGPGRADATKKAIHTVHSQNGIENSWLELLVSLGLPGVTLAFALCGYCLWRARAARSLTGFGAVTAFVLVAASFNLIEAQWPTLILFGSVLGIAAAREPLTGPAMALKPATASSR